MTTLDLLERAHARLAELRDAAVPGPWTITIEGHIDGDDRYVATDGYVDGIDTGSVPLVVALHRTIDAQLALIADMIERYRPVPDFKPVAPTAIMCVALARAILGEEA
ncbi:hypothetical protein [Mycetocola saprophilus]|uniref:hypothetical protein n=1 Tax=Mycetocola saprophilus TaxID=76636 RepID=UPI0004BF992E|nr:hypothetical protein [Mycetocola saprophilus]